MKISKTRKTVQITKNLEISIISAGPDYSLDESIWAINWFNVKSKRLYDFYNIITDSNIKKVRGRFFFKGRLKKWLLGEMKDEREMLLIVTYYKAYDFLEMIMNKTFQLKNIVRKLSTKDFTFGFTKRIDDGEPPKIKSIYEGKLIYMVHHFKNNHQLIDSKAIKEYAATKDIFTHFSGIKSALICSKKTGEQLKTAPFLMDGILIFGAFESSQFDEFIASDFYQDFISQNKSNYIGLFNREI